MKLIHVTQPGGPEVLTVAEGPRPQPGTGELLIRVAAAGVNRPDILQRKGAYPPPAGASPILGLEVAGTVEECGPQSGDWKKGDPVCALLAGGGYAEYCVAPAPQCLPIPSGLSMEEAAGIPENYFTVWSNVFERGRLQPGETLLVHGGSSGIGTTAIQLAHTWGARVIATAGSDEKCRACRDFGAEGAINYNIQDFVAESRALTGGRGVDVILDMVAGEYFARNLEALAPEGRIVQIATQKGEKVELSIRALMAKGATVTGSTLRPRSVAQKGAIAAALFREVWPWLESRKVQIRLDRVFNLAQADLAHQRMESSQHIGKIVLKVIS